MKPKCKLAGTDGNVFAIIGRVAKTLERSGLGNGYELAKEFRDKAMNSASYDAVLQLCSEYVAVR